MSNEAKKVNKLYDLDNRSMKSDNKKINSLFKNLNKENYKKVKMILLIIVGIFITLFLFGAYVFHTYDIDFSDTAFEKQDLSDCYLN